MVGVRVPCSLQLWPMSREILFARVAESPPQQRAVSFEQTRNQDIQRERAVFNDPGVFFSRIQTQVSSARLFCYWKWLVPAVAAIKLWRSSPSDRLLAIANYVRLSTYVIATSAWIFSSPVKRKPHRIRSFHQMQISKSAHQGHWWGRKAPNKASWETEDTKEIAMQFRST